MRAIKTVTADLIKKVLSEGFNAATLISDNAHKAEAATIDPDEVREVIERLRVVADTVEPFFIERRREVAAKKLEELKTNDKLRELLGEFSSLEDLLIAGGVVPTQKEEEPEHEKVSKKSSSNSNNKTFMIELYDADTGKLYTGKSTNKTISFDDKKEGSKAYERLLQKDETMKDFDTFMRKYSKEYSEEYDLNAEYNGNKFHLNKRGKLNQYAMVHFEDFKKKDKSGADDKTLLAKFKEKVLNS
ncbi:TPA: hypothetical protein RCG93_003012 [Enterobacter roggenkampii]|nr:hypothetical protein [Enterobacter roggenkampii]